MYYTLIHHIKNGKDFYILKRSYYSKSKSEYVDASTIFLDKQEYDTLLDFFHDYRIKYQYFDNTKGEK